MKWAVVITLCAACGGAPERVEPDRPLAKPPVPCPPPWTGVADLHIDLPYQVVYRDRPVDLSEPGVDVTAASLRAGNARLLVLSLYVPSKQRSATVDDLWRVLENAEEIVETNRALLSELDARVVFAVEGSRMLAGHEDRIPELVSRGVVAFGLVHRHHNALADSSQDRHKGSGGLSEQGKAFVTAVLSAGAMIDVSHASDDTVRDTVALARALGGVVLATHSNARAVFDHERNLPDDLLEAVAGTGGLIGLNFHSGFLRRRGAASIDDVVRHAMHMIDVVGAEHVAIGSDFDGNIRPPADLRTHAEIPDLAEALKQAGLSDADVDRIVGRNAHELIEKPKRRPGCPD